MKRIEMCLAALALASLCAPAMGVPLLYLADTSGNPLTTVQAGLDETLQIAVFIDGVVDMAGFQVGITIDDGGTAIQPFGTVSLDYGPPDLGTWYVDEASAAADTYPEWVADVSVWWRTPWQLSSMVYGAPANPLFPPVGTPPPLGISGSGDIAIFHIDTGDVEGTATISIDGNYTIIGDRDGYEIVSTLGDPITIEISGAQDTLTLDAQDIYVQPGEQFEVNLDVSALGQPVNGCQAFLGYDDSVLNGIGVAAGGAPWSELIYSSWEMVPTADELDLAVGAPDGTDADGTIAVITFEVDPSAPDGTVTIDFRPDGDDLETTMLSDLSAQPVMPQKVNSQTITIDGTKPIVAITSVMQGSTDLTAADTWAVEGDVTVVVTASDATTAIAGPPTLTATDSNGQPIAVGDPMEDPAGTFTYTLTIDGNTATCTADLHAAATDLAGNVGTAEETFEVDVTDPEISIASVTQGGTDLTAPSTWAVEGTVTIVVNAADPKSGLADAPTLTATDSNGDTIAVGAPTENPPGTFTYTLTIDENTASCTASVSTSVSDNAGRSNSAAATFEVDVDDPVIAITSITQDGRDVTAGYAMEGTVTVVVEASDAKSDLAGAPVLTAADSASGAILVSGPAGGPGTYTYTLTIDGNTAEGTATVDVSVSDNAGNSNSASGTFGVDVTDPSIAIDSASQGGVELLGVSVNALQGVVSIDVTATDALSGLDGTPSVTVTPNGGTAETATFVSQAGDTFTYQWTITAATPNGTAVIDASVSDNAGNTSSDAASFNVNKNQVAVSIQLEDLAPQSGGIVRTVVFKATNAAGDVLMTWTEDILFTTDTVDLYTLTDVPQATVALSAKTDWNLRRKIEGLDMSANDGQAAADFTGDTNLPGGDINGTNGVNILDWSLMKINWFSDDPVADITGDGQVNLSDYITMKRNWFTAGDPE